MPFVVPFVILALVAGWAGCGSDPPRPRQAPPGLAIGASEVHVPARLSSVATGDLDPLGRPLRVACDACHSLRTPAELPTSMTALTEFHQGLEFRHGELSCASCHLAGARPRLHRADGTPVALRDAIAICRDCHGPQARDYDRGAHGGMSGFWDLSRGGRSRNHCVDCHDPHQPRFPSTTPVLLPRDRGLAGEHPRSR